MTALFKVKLAPISPNLTLLASACPEQANERLGKSLEICY